MNLIFHVPAVGKVLVRAVNTFCIRNFSLGNRFLLFKNRGPFGYDGTGPTFGESSRLLHLMVR